MSLDKRETAVNEFNTDPEVLFLRSTLFSPALHVYSQQVNIENYFHSSGKSNAYVTEGWQSWSKHGSCLPCDYARSLVEPLC